jgi:integrase
MARVNLTDARIRALKPAATGRRYEVHDAEAPGLIIRVTATGHKSLMFRGRGFPNSRHPIRRAIGEVGSITLDAARTTARQWQELLRRGLDPAVETKEQRRRAAAAQAHKTATTFSTVADEYIARRLRGHRKRVRVEHQIRKELISQWGDRPLSEITRRDVVKLIEAIIDRPRPPSSAGKAPSGAYARNVLDHIRSLFNWAINRGIYDIETSPCDRIRPKDLVGIKVARDHVLDDYDIRAFWQAADRVSYPFGPMFQLLMLTGARLSEVSDARWSEFDLQGRLWSVPAARYKTGAVHVVPLTQDVLTLLERLPRFMRGDHLFSTTFGTKPVDGFSKAKNRLDRLMLEELRTTRGDDAELQPFVIHDIRRTTRTQLSSLRVPDAVAEMVIGHGRKGIQRIYDRHTYLSEMREALELWQTKLRTIVNPPPSIPADNVVQLRAGV